MWLKYNQDVLQNMKTNFKNNSLSLKKQTTYKEEVLKDLKIQLS